MLCNITHKWEGQVRRTFVEMSDEAFEVYAEQAVEQRRAVRDQIALALEEAARALKPRRPTDHTPEPVAA